MGQAGQRLGLSPRVTIAVFVAAVTTLSAASVAWACTAFLGEFEVRGDQSGTVKAIGEDDRNTFGMNQTIEGVTEATSGTSPDGPGSVEIRTSKTDDNTKIPASDDTDPSGNKLGLYDVNFVNGPSYQDHEQWVVDCMTYFEERTVDEATGGRAQSEVQKLGEAEIGNSGQIKQAWDAQGNSLSKNNAGFWGSFPLPATSTPSGQDDVDLEATQFGEASVCISDDHGWFGNQVPVTML